jgi:hypothetical protein
LRSKQNKKGEYKRREGTFLQNIPPWFRKILRWILNIHGTVIARVIRDSGKLSIRFLFEKRVYGSCSGASITYWYMGGLNWWGIGIN